VITVLVIFKILIAGLVTLDLAEDTMPWDVVHAVGYLYAVVAGQLLVPSHA
jgi:hypothetical protein